MINWKVRFKNKTFWLTLIPALGVLASAIAAVFGVTLELNEITEKLLKVVIALFAVLGILGVVNDPTTNGVSDSERAMTYDKPWKDEKNDTPSVED